MSPSQTMTPFEQQARFLVRLPEFMAKIATPAADQQARRRLLGNSIKPPPVTARTIVLACVPLADFLALFPAPEPEGVIDTTAVEMSADHAAIAVLDAHEMSGTQICEECSEARPRRYPCGFCGGADPVALPEGE